MAQQIPTLEAAPGQEAEAPRAGKGKLFIILTVLLLVLVGGGAGAYFTLVDNDTKDKKAGSTAEEADPKSPALYVLMPMRV